MHDRLGAGKLRAKSRQSFFIRHPMRFGSAQLARRGEQGAGGDDIVNGEAELPQIGWRFVAQPEGFEQEFGSEFELHRFTRQFSTDK